MGFSPTPWHRRPRDASPDFSHPPRLRQDLATRLGDDVIRAACRAAGHTWCDSALLTPAAIIHWFLIQVLHGNTALTHVSLLTGRAFTASAFCQARGPGSGTQLGALPVSRPRPRFSPPPYLFGDWHIRQANAHCKERSTSARLVTRQETAHHV